MGDKNLLLLEKLLGGARIIDLLWHRPIDFIDRSYEPKLAHAREGRVATIAIEILEHRPNKRAGLPYRVIGGDETGFVDLLFFNVRGNYLEAQYPINADVRVCGKLERRLGKWQIIHPDKIAPGVDIKKFEPVYGLTAGITHKVMNKVMASALPAIPALPEWLDAPLKAREKWPDFSVALRTLHTIESESDLSAQTVFRRRLAYDELLSNQLTIALVRERERGPRGRVFPTSTTLRPKFLKNLPFELTGAQKGAIAEIDADMMSPTRMMRLLQGDVGSGKTVVAALAMLNAVEAGAQAAIMAPTEILAQQHARTLIPMFDALHIPSATLTGRHKGRERDDILAGIANGGCRVIIGTHALFQDDIEFYDLGMAVIDEQHRFGVHQRLQLTKKGATTDMLVMTATPIPRTLELTQYGELDVSRLSEKPPGRKPVDTRLIPLPKLDEMIGSLKSQIANGVQIYWVCPLVEESELLDLAAATERYKDLFARFGDQVGLIHGQMKPKEKDDVMAAFSRGDLRILVATTVIEVGVNVPNATIMVIEHAERYGLAQLHQLRGRVGRGSAQSFCFLLYHPECTLTARERLKIMRESEDGFLIAEKDLQLRGPGDILGTKQSGVPEFRVADLSVHGDLLAIAGDEARVIINKDPKLEGPRGDALRHLLYLFERDRAIRLLYSG